MPLAIVRTDPAYELMLWLHILTVVVGFGSTFVWPFLAAKSRQLGDPKVGYYVSQMSMQGGTILSTYFIYGAGVTGLILLLFGATSDPAYWEFSDTWISIAFLLYFAGLAVSLGLHSPNLKAMLALQEQLATAEGPPPGAAAGGPPPQVAELQERGKRAGMYGGILHLLFVLILLDMVFKPGA
jgi:hypothetical protein